MSVSVSDGSFSAPWSVLSSLRSQSLLTLDPIFSLLPLPLLSIPFAASPLSLSLHSTPLHRCLSSPSLLCCLSLLHHHHRCLSLAPYWYPAPMTDTRTRSGGDQTKGADHYDSTTTCSRQNYRRVATGRRVRTACVLAAALNRARINLTQLTHPRFN